MYVHTTFSIGDTVYFTDDGACVVRAQVREIRVTQYKHDTHTRYLLAYGVESEVTREDSKLHRSPDAAFRDYDSEHPQVVELAPEVAEAA